MRAWSAFGVGVCGVHHDDFAGRIGVDNARAAGGRRRDGGIVDRSSGRAAENRKSRTVASETASTALATDEDRGRKYND